MVNNFGGDIVYIPGVKDWTQQTVRCWIVALPGKNSRGLIKIRDGRSNCRGTELNHANAKMAYHALLNAIDQII